MWNRARPRPRRRRPRRGRRGGRRRERRGRRTARPIGRAARTAGTARAVNARRRASGPRNRIPPRTSAADGDPGQEAGDDRQTRPHGPERTSTSGRRRPRRPAATMPVPCQAWPSASRTRFVPALLTALGVTLLAAGLLSYTTPVTAEAIADGQSRAGSGRGRDAGTAHHAAAARVVGPPTAPERPGRPGRDASPGRRPQDRPAGRQAGRQRTTTRCATSRCRSARSASRVRAARPTSTPTPARGCSCRSSTASRIKNGKKMLGMVVEVWTSDDQRFLYEIVEVRRAPARPRRRPRRDAGAALAPDLGGSQGHARQAPGHRQAALAGGGRPRRRPPEAQARRLRVTCGPARSSRSSAGRPRRRPPGRSSGR